MKLFARLTPSRNVVTIGLALLSLCGATTAGADNRSKPGDANSSCHQETRRVAIWPHVSPKAQQHARFELREVTICDGEVVARRKPERVRQAHSQP